MSLKTVWYIQKDGIHPMLSHAGYAGYAMLYNFYPSIPFPSLSELIYLPYFPYSVSFHVQTNQKPRVSYYSSSYPPFSPPPSFPTHFTPNPAHKSNAPSTAPSKSPTLSLRPLFSALSKPTVSQATLESFPWQFSQPGPE